MTGTTGEKIVVINGNELITTEILENVIAEINEGFSGVAGEITNIENILGGAGATGLPGSIQGRLDDLENLYGETVVTGVTGATGPDSYNISVISQTISNEGLTGSTSAVFTIPLVSDSSTGNAGLISPVLNAQIGINTGNIDILTKVVDTMTLNPSLNYMAGPEGSGGTDFENLMYIWDNGTGTGTGTINPGDSIIDTTVDNITFMYVVFSSDQNPVEYNGSNVIFDTDNRRAFIRLTPRPAEVNIAANGVTGIVQGTTGNANITDIANQRSISVGTNGVMSTNGALVFGNLQGYEVPNIDQYIDDPILTGTIDLTSITGGTGLDIGTILGVTGYTDNVWRITAIDTNYIATVQPLAGTDETVNVGATGQIIYTKNYIDSMVVGGGGGGNINITTEITGLGNNAVPTSAAVVTYVADQISETLDTVISDADLGTTGTTGTTGTIFTESITYTVDTLSNAPTTAVTGDTLYAIDTGIVSIFDGTNWSTIESPEYMILVGDTGATSVAPSQNAVQNLINDIMQRDVIYARTKVEYNSVM